MTEVNQAENWYVEWTRALMTLAAKNFKEAGETMPEGYEALHGDVCARTLLQYLVGRNPFMSMGPTEDALFGILRIPRSYESGQFMDRILDMGGTFKSLLEDEDPEQGRGLLAYSRYLGECRKNQSEPKSPAEFAYKELCEIITLLGAEVPEIGSETVRELASFLRKANAS